MTSILPEAAAAGVLDGRGEGLPSLSGRRLGGRRRPVPALAMWPHQELPGGRGRGPYVGCAELRARGLGGVVVRGAAGVSWGQDHASLAMIQVTVRSPCGVGGQGRLLAVPETVAEVDQEACGSRAETGCESGRRPQSQDLLRGRGPAPQVSPHDFRQGHLYTWQRQARLSGQPCAWQATGWGPLEGRWCLCLIHCPPGGAAALWPLEGSSRPSRSCTGFPRALGLPGLLTLSVTAPDFPTSGLDPQVTWEFMQPTNSVILLSFRGHRGLWLDPEICAPTDHLCASDKGEQSWSPGACGGCSKAGIPHLCREAGSYPQYPSVTGAGGFGHNSA